MFNLLAVTGDGTPPLHTNSDADKFDPAFLVIILAIVVIIAVSIFIAFMLVRDKRNPKETTAREDIQAKDTEDKDNGVENLSEEEKQLLREYRQQKHDCEK